jgi:hypothetical protein
VSANDAFASFTLAVPTLFSGEVWDVLVVVALAPPRSPEIAAVRTRVFIDLVIKVLLWGWLCFGLLRPNCLTRMRFLNTERAA